MLVVSVVLIGIFWCFVSANVSSTQDPYWPQMWYLNRSLWSDKVDLNVTGAWAQGFSGKGVVVAVVDDGLELVCSQNKIDSRNNNSTKIFVRAGGAYVLAPKCFVHANFA